MQAAIARLSTDAPGAANAPGELEPLRRLGSAAEQIWHHSQQQSGQCDIQQRRLLEALMTAAADAERYFALQRDRIRYLEDLSITDELTGLLNRRGFKLELTRALSRAERVKESGLLLLCDLDDFKRINDNHGHAAGDAVLCSVAELLRRHVRRSDSIARLGGDEFAVLMTNTPRGPAQPAMRKLVRLVNGLEVEWEGARIGLAASFGFARYDRTSSAQQLQLESDLALYRAKRAKMAGTARL
jgi:diguanylate cyclase (GGDEF)-like protein